MGNLFNMDNKFFTFMSRVADLMILNITCLICCIPIITIGPAVTALYYVTQKMAKDEDSYIFRSYFRSFKQNFRQGTIIWLIFMVVGGLFFMDLHILSQYLSNASYSRIFYYIILAMIIIAALVLLYVFPVLSKFENSIKHTLKNSFLMCIRHLPYTAIIAAITVVPPLLIIFVESLFAYGILAYLLLGFATVAFCNSFFFVKIFENYIPDEEKDADTIEEEYVISDEEAELNKYYIPREEPKADLTEEASSQPDAAEEEEIPGE